MMSMGLLVLLTAAFAKDYLLVVGELYEGNPCTTSKGPGVCQILDEKCQSVYKDLLSNKTPELICGYKRTVPIVCCTGSHASTVGSTEGPPIWDFGSETTKSTWKPTRPTTTSAKYRPNNRQTMTTTSRSTASKNPHLNSRPARRMCAEYAKSVYAESSVHLLIGGDRTPANESLCAIKDKKLIVGGTNAEPKEFPHSAAIGYKSGSKIRWDCGGTLISDTFVLTAAHCLHSSQWGSPVVVRVGDLNLKRTDDVAKPQNRRIIEQIRHPNYKRPSQYHDIALLRLESAVTFDAYVRPACLDIKGDHSVDEKVVATGWGTVEFEGDTADDLQKVTFPIVNLEECKKNYLPNRNNLPNGILEGSQLCAGQLQKDTCQGDSGGPLAVYSTDEDCMYDVIGVTSFGAACGVTYGIYTKVYYYLPWIESIIWQPNSG